MGLLMKLGKYALVGAASILIYEGAAYVSSQQQPYKVETIESKHYVIDLTASPPDTIAAPKLFQVYGMYKDVESKTGNLEMEFSAAKGWYDRRRAH